MVHYVNLIIRLQSFCTKSLSNKLLNVKENEHTNL